MKRHLNTLFITTDGSYLSKEGQAVKVKVEKETRLRVPLINLDGIVCFGGVGCSPDLMGACAKAGVTISFLNRYGGFKAAVTGFSPGNVLLRRTQYRVADSAEQACLIARNIVAAKIANCRTVLMRAIRDGVDVEAKTALQQASQAMRDPLESARKATQLDSLRGNEGDAAATYFGVFQNLINDRESGFHFKTRSRWTRSTRCSRFSIRCSVTTVARPAKRPASMQPSGSFIATGQVDLEWHWISWRSFVRSLSTDLSCH